MVVGKEWFDSYKYTNSQLNTLKENTRGKKLKCDNCLDYCLNNIIIIQKLNVKSNQIKNQNKFICTAHYQNKWGNALFGVYRLEREGK